MLAHLIVIYIYLHTNKTFFEYKILELLNKIHLYPEAEAENINTYVAYN